MRVAMLLLTAVPLSGTGCSYLIHERHAERKSPKNTTEVRAQLGEPVASGNVEGVQYEQFETRKKYVDVIYTGPGYAMGLVITGGLVELLLTPRELYLQSKRLLFRQHILVCYDEKGRVVSFEVNRWGLKPLLPKSSVVERVNKNRGSEEELTWVPITSRSESESSQPSRPPASSPSSSSPPP